MKKYSKFLAILLAVAMVLPGMAGVAEAAALESGDSLNTVIDLNLRSKENDRSAPVVYVPRGKTVEFLSVAKNDYFELEYAGRKGYAHRSNVTAYYGTGEFVEVELEEDSNGKTYKVVKDDVLKSKNKKNALPTAILERGDEVVHKGTTANDYFLVEADGTKGYIYRGDVTSPSNFDNGDEFVKVKTVKETPMSEKLTAIRDDVLRAKDRSDAGATALLEKGDEVTYKGTTDNDWFHVETENGTDGYIYRGYLTDSKYFPEDPEDPEEPEAPEELTVESVSAINATTLEVTLSDDTVHEVELDKALEPNVETEVTFEIDGNEYTATVTWEVAEDTEFPAEPDVEGMEEDLEALAAEIKSLEKDWAEADKDADYYHAIYQAEKAKGNDTAAEIAKDNRDEAIEKRDAINTELVEAKKDRTNKNEELRVAKLELEAIQAAKKAAETNKWSDYETANTLANNLPGKSKVKSDLQEINKKTSFVNDAIDTVNDYMVELPNLKDIDSTNAGHKTAIKNAKTAIYDAKALKPSLDFSEEETQIKKLETAMDRHAERIKENNATAKVENAEAWLNKDSVTNAQINHDAAVKLVKELKDGKVKTDLTARLMEVQKGIDEIKADRAAAKEVTQMISDIKWGTNGDAITRDNVAEVKVKVEAARAAYDALTEEQQELVTVGNLVAREDRVKKVETEMEKEAKAAKEVTDLIAALPDKDTAYNDLTPNQREAVAAANRAYNDLNRYAKKLVSEDNVEKLDKLVKTVDAK